MISLRKLNMHGAAHIIAVMGVVVGAGIIGSYLLVASHADSCTPTSSPTSSPVSGATSAPTCTPTSSPTSSPTPTTQLATCRVTGVPATVAKGTVLTPSLVVKNVGTGAFVVNLSTSVLTSDGVRTHLTSYSINNFAPGVTRTHALASYTVPANTTATSATIHANDTDAKTAFSCSLTFNIAA